jgi:nitroreductase
MNVLLILKSHSLGGIMKCRLLLVLFFSLSFLPLFVFSQSKNEAITAFISSVYSKKSFTAVPVETKDIDMILQCGIKAPSARNSQPWHFTVIKDVQIMKKIIPDAIEGNVLIVISGSDQGNGATFDCGLATENMYLAAQALGLGSHIYTGPIAGLNQNYKGLIGIPAGYSGISIIKIGNIQNKVDSASSASPRKPGNDMVNYK